MPDSLRSLAHCAALLLLVSGAGCGAERGPTPTEVCDWLDECFGAQPGCEKGLIPTYEQAAEAGCSAELAGQLNCLIEQECQFDGTECADESLEFSECIGAVPL